nr:tyrosine-type recombinase/integrase [Cupriavidus sp. USMAA2-4]
MKYFLNQASAHSLRHTAGSHMTDQEVDLRLVCDNFGHASIATTCAYLPSEEDARHEATQGAAPHRLDQQDLG